MKRTNKKILITLIAIGALLFSTIDVDAKNDVQSNKIGSNAVIILKKSTKKTTKKKTDDKSTKKTTSTTSVKSCQDNCKKKNTGQSAINACIRSCSDQGAIKVPTSTSDVQFCASTAKVWKIVGAIFTIFKILIPIILIITASIDLAHAVINADDSIGKALKKLFTRFILAVVIFLLPTVITLVIGFFVGFSENGIAEDYEYCKNCILNPTKCDTSNDVSTSTTR